MANMLPAGQVTSIAYYIHEGLHHVPSLVPVAQAAGGVVLTTDPVVAATLLRDYPALAVEGFTSVAAVNRHLNRMRPDAVVGTDFTVTWLRLAYRPLHVQIFHGTSDKRYGTSHHLREYDLMLLPGERSRLQKQRAGLLKPGNHAVVGYPKIDRVFRGEIDKERVAARLGLGAGPPVVLYAPTWRDGSGNSSLPRFALELLRTTPPGCTLLVKLHAKTLSGDSRNADRLRAASRGVPGVVFLEEDYDIIPLMAVADLLITDISAVAHEFLCFDRPFVFLDPRVLPWRRPAWVWRCGPVVRRPTEVWPAVARALADPGAFARERREAFAEVFAYRDGESARRAAAAIHARLPGRPGG